jgi:hypothetical protein
MLWRLRFRFQGSSAYVDTEYIIYTSAGFESLDENIKGKIESCAKKFFQCLEGRGW